MSDPVLAKSAWLSSYMSQHADTLVAYVLQHLQAKASNGKGRGVQASDIKNIKMTQISSQSMKIEYSDASDGGKVKNVEIAFDPPLDGFEEVRPRLLQMKNDAEEAIGMVKRPVISTYRLPRARRTIPIVIAILFWVGCALQENDNGFFGRIRNLTGGYSTVEYTGYFMVAVHTAEAAYQFLNCLKYSTPFFQTVMWVLTTFLVGFPALSEFRNLVREAKVASVSKTK